MLGPRLSATPRHALDRIYTLALLYRLDRKRQYLDRAAKEMRAIAAFQGLESDPLRRHRGNYARHGDRL